MDKAVILVSPVCASFDQFRNDALPHPSAAR
jgi:UDP-N-acetylmuramoylalanine-D-glutamate ligase